MVRTITSLNEIPEDTNVVIDFYANWCGPCKQIAPLFVEMSARYPEIVFLKVNIDESDNLASVFKINALPTFVFVKNGMILKRVEGAAPSKIIDILEIMKQKS